MRRGFLIGVLASLLCVSPALVAQRGGGGIELHGIPASVTDPGRNGVPRGIPASVTDPTPRTNLGRVPGNFNGHGHHHGTPVFALPYYGYYGSPFYDYSDYAQYDPTQAQQSQAQPQPQPQSQSQPQVIIIREEPNPEDDSRYGQHSFEEGDDSDSSAPAHDRVAQARPAPVPQPKVDDSPATTLVFRDGHKMEVHNYAIVGSNLVDLTKSPVLKKIPLDSLDLDATRKANEDNGVDFHTP